MAKLVYTCPYCHEDIECRLLLVILPCSITCENCGRKILFEVSRERKPPKQQNTNK